jgi:mRNA interferase MazF
MTPFGMTLKQKDIVLIPIPFTDLAAQKKRPAAIISSNTYNTANADIVVVALTSNLETRDFTIMVSSADLTEGLLKATSMIRVDKIYTLDKSIVIKKIGSLNNSVFENIIASLNRLVSAGS